MHLKLFVITIFLLYVLIVCGGFTLYRIGIVHPQLTENAWAQQKSGMRAVKAALDSEAERANQLIQDWAKWNDLYRYVQTPTQDFEDSNLGVYTLEEYDLNAMYILALDKTLVLGIEEESAGNFARSVSALTTSRLSEISKRTWPKNSKADCQYQYVLDELSLVCLSTIQDSSAELAPRGYLVFSRSIRLETLLAIQGLTNTDFDVINPLSGDAQTNMGFENVLHQGSVATDHFVRYQNPSSHNASFIIHFRFPSNSIPTAIDTQTLLIIFILFVVPLLLVYLVSKTVLDPLTNMAHFIGALKNSESRPVLPNSGAIIEVKIISDALSELMNHLDNERLMLEHKSVTDVLTGINNRRAFEEQMPSFWNTSPRLGKPVAIILLDIDFFKRYNDTLGHQQGDEALKAVAHALQNACRRDTDKLYRYGGEEFAILTLVDHNEGLSLFMQALQRTIERLYLPHPSSPVSNALTMSMGACLIKEPSSWMSQHSYKTAVEIADKALYEAKASGRNTFVIHTMTEDGVEIVDSEQDSKKLPHSNFNPINKLK